MNTLDDFDPTPPKMPKLPALVVDPIHGVHPFDGARNPVTRSNTAHRVSMQISTAATGWQPKLYHFENQPESSTVLAALLSGQVYGLEVQLPPFKFKVPGRSELDHFYDLRITCADGFRRAVFVRNASSLATPDTQAEIDAIHQSIPADFADDAITVNGNDYTRAYRDNLRRIWHLSLKPNPAADQHVEAVARSTSFWLLRELIAQCDLPTKEAYQAAMRLVGQGVFTANWHAALCIHSRVWLTT